MQPRSLDAIISELNTTYNPQIQSVQQQQAMVDPSLQADETALDAKKTSAFGDILDGARRRGTGVAFGGIPLGEQAKYTSTDYLPALTKLRQGAQQQKLSLQDALNQIYEKRNTFGQQIKQNEDQLYESKRQFDTNMQWEREKQAQALKAAAAANAASFSPSYGGGGISAGNPKSATMSQRGDKGFDFTDATGRPINAAAFAAAKGIPFRTLLDQMAKAGDNGAKSALGFVGNDYGYDPSKITTANAAGLYQALTGRSANVSAPLPSGTSPLFSSKSSNGLSYF